MTDPKPEDLRIPKRMRPWSISHAGKGRLICIGDVHGCVEELAQLMEELQLKPEDILVFLGDYVDRGPASGAVVQFIRELCESRPGTFAVLGNHDEKHARARRHLMMKRLNPGYAIPMKKFFGDGQRAREHAELSDADCLWIAKLPSVIRLDRRDQGEPRIFTHAGLIEGCTTDQQTAALIRNRFVKLDEKGRWDSVPCDRGPKGEYLQPPGSKIWDEIWTGPRVITGHIVHSLELPRIQGECFGIDTGCCFGGRLTAYVEDLPTGKTEMVQVQAKREYCPFSQPEA